MRLIRKVAPWFLVATMASSLDWPKSVCVVSCYGFTSSRNRRVLHLRTPQGREWNYVKHQLCTRRDIILVFGQTCFTWSQPGRVGKYGIEVLLTQHNTKSVNTFWPQVWKWSHNSKTNTIIDLIYAADHETNTTDITRTPNVVTIKRQ